MSRVNTILFDFDGTLADTNNLIASSHLHVLDRYFPGQYTKEMVRKYNGPSLEQTYTELMPEHVTEAVTMYREFNHRVHDELITSFPDVEASLKELKASGLKLVVVSTKYEYVLKRGLEVLGLSDYFDLIIAGDQIQQVKPDPEQLQLAMTTLKVEPQQCLMIGDNWQDIAAGENAGVETVFVEWSEKTVSELAPHKPNKTVSSMLELTEWIKTKSYGGER